MMLTPVAEANEDLAKTNGCAACHALEKKGVGPAWKSIAAKYKGTPGIEAQLQTKVRAGGKGVWGNVPMPAQDKISDADLKAILAWMMTL